LNYFKYFIKTQSSWLVCYIFIQFLVHPSSAYASKQLLTYNDFQYIGPFLLPSTGVGGDGLFSQGLTFRYVNNELHMFSVAWNPQDLYEVRSTV
jgi:hypothetical protein